MSEGMKQIMGQLREIKSCAVLKDRLRGKGRQFLRFLLNEGIKDKRRAQGCVCSTAQSSTPQGITDMGTYFWFYHQLPI